MHAKATQGQTESALLKRRIRVLLALFIIGLVLSGVTAVPLPGEVAFLDRVVGEGSAMGAWWPDLAAWVSRIYRGVMEASRQYPFLLYGTDWLAFGHIVIAISFLGPLRDPVKNVWVIEFGMIACILVIPWALIFGPIRGIPFFWRLIDCSFGVVGIIPLYVAWRYTRRIIEIDAAGSD
jgi:hypothetical protein